MQAAADAEKLRQKLFNSEVTAQKSLAELLRMKIQRRRAEVQLGMSAAQRVMADDEVVEIRKYASDAEWNELYAQWLAERGEVIPDEPPSDIEVMERINAGTQQTIDNLLKRLDQMHNADMSPENSKT